MKRTVTDCDGCKKQAIEPVEVSFCIGTLPDPAGGPSMDNDVDLDLCQSCAARAFGKLKSRAKLSHDDARWLVEQILGKERAANKLS